MIDYFPLIIVCLIGIQGIRYCWQTKQGEIEPSLATWTLFMVATSLQLFTYLCQSASHSLTSNIYATADTIMVAVILGVICFWGKRTNRFFSSFDQKCLLGAGVVWGMWLVGQVFFRESHLICNLFIQTIMIVAYFPTYYKLWRAEKKTEPYFTWVIALVSSLLAICLTVAKQDILASIYIARAIISVLVVLFLLLRLDLRLKRTPLS